VTAPSAIPVPDAGMVRVGLLASEVTMNDPVRAPALVGEKRVLKETLCPAASVIGALTPFTENPLPLAEIAEIVIVEVPGLVRVS
jgi:hypothetical protein